MNYPTPHPTNPPKQPFGDHLGIGIPMPIHQFCVRHVQATHSDNIGTKRAPFFFGSANLYLQSCPHWVQAPGKGGRANPRWLRAFRFFFWFQVSGSQKSMDPWNLQPMNSNIRNNRTDQHDKPTFAQRQWIKAKLQGDSRHAGKTWASICSPFSHGAFHSPQKNYGK